MPATFHFRAMTADGKLRTGVITGDTERYVATELRRQGLTPVYIGAQAQKSAWSFELPDLANRKRRSVLFFTQEISTLLNATVPLDRALFITSELTEARDFRPIVQDVLRTLKGGKSFADSLATHPKYFGDLYVNMVRAGEASGSLATVFDRLSEFERTRDDLRNFIIGAMIYPALLACVGLSSIFLIMYYVVPRFAQAFEASQMRIPAPTQMMLDASRFVQAYGIYFIAAAIFAIGALQAYIRTTPGRLWWDNLRLRIPLLGDALRKAETARFARAMSTLIANSVPLVQSLGIARAILNNKVIANALELVSLGVKRGEGISKPLEKTAVFPPLAAHLLAVGEETGRLDAMFARMADIYETDTRNAIKRFTSVFEPIVILIMGVIVGALILSMMLAITSVNEVAI
jgi:general secretion pathway protein F